MPAPKPWPRAPPLSGAGSIAAPLRAASRRAARSGRPRRGGRGRSTARIVGGSSDAGPAARLASCAHAIDSVRGGQRPVSDPVRECLSFQTETLPAANVSGWIRPARATMALRAGQKPAPLGRRRPPAPDIYKEEGFHGTHAARQGDRKSVV